MSVNGITNTTAAYNSYQTGSTKKETSKVKEDTSSKEVSKEAKEDSGVIYEASKETKTTAPKKYKQNKEMIAKLKADADARTSQLKSLVEKLMLGQGNAIGTADDMWSFLRTGNFTVDAETKAQAQADIAEDGYWGVNQTSDRILDFAKAISGGDPDKIQEMRDAFEKGFRQAEKTWGGKLPDISQRTYEATMKKFDDWAAEATGAAAQEN